MIRSTHETTCLKEKKGAFYIRAPPDLVSLYSALSLLLPLGHLWPPRAGTVTCTPSLGGWEGRAAERQCECLCWLLVLLVLPSEVTALSLEGCLAGSSLSWEGASVLQGAGS